MRRIERGVQKGGGGGWDREAEAAEKVWSMEARKNKFKKNF